MMYKYSCTYTKVNPNFCIFIPNKDNNLVASDELAIFSVVKNIINRSCFTYPTTYLKQNLGDISRQGKFKTFFYYKSDKILNWNTTIKGGTTSNPALDFYNIYLLQNLNNDLFLHNTFIPELSFDQIIDDPNDLKLKNSFLDFYSPQLKCAIEIDGIQHKKQALSDALRDQKLKDNGIQVIRISTKDYNKPNKEINNFVKNFNKINYISHYAPTIMNYDACIRYQMLILKLLENGIISIYDNEWNFSIFQNEEIDKNVLFYAIKDVINWINKILILCNKENINPIINTNNKDKLENCIYINLDLKNPYDGNILNDDSNTIYIRNDYFEYDQEANITYEDMNKFPYCKNYYKVENGYIEYKTYKRTKEQKNALLYILKEIFRFNNFKPNQEDIICESLDKGSVIGLLPTGAGKSLCYQFISLLLPGITLVISPLKVLMKDQYESMVEKYGITNICFVNSSNKKDTDIIKNYQSKITLISPERFFNDEFLTILKNEKTQVSLVTIDEVHCLSEWGHDFRTSYLCLSHYLKENINNKCKLLGLTATASPRVLEDIKVEFNNYKGYTTVIQSVSLARDNLHLNVHKYEPGKNFKSFGLDYQYNRKYQCLLNIYNDKKEFDNKTIVFTKTKSKSYGVNDSCYNLALRLKHDLNINQDNHIIDYFASNDDETENTNNKKLENFRNGDTKLLFSTKAFGMGVDIPDIRRTIHFALPSSIESLYQEFGRAGRDGVNSTCDIWYYGENQNLFHNLFDNDFTMNKINSVKDGFNEFSTNLFFLTNQTLDINQELFFEEYVYNYIKDEVVNKGQKSFFVKTIAEEFDKHIGVTYSKGFKDKITKEVPEKYDLLYNKNFNYKNFIDKALYRLYLLGKISMWSIKYVLSIDNPLISNINITNNSIDDQINHLNSYIRKYEPKYNYNNKKDENLILKELITWAFNHFVYQQVQSIKNIYEYCEEFKDSKQFMNIIVKYLSSDKETSKLLSFPDDYEFWFKLIKNTQIDELKSIISRYLESDDKLVSLNFISGVTRLQLDDYENTDGRRRLIMAFNMIKNYDKKDQESIIMNLFNLIKLDRHKDLLVETIISVDIKFIPIIYKYYQNDLLDSELICDFAKKITLIGGKLNVRLRKNESNN